MPTKKRHLRRLTTLPLPAWFHNVKVVSLYSRINSPASTRRIEKTTFRCKFVLKFTLILVFFFNVICEQLFNISLILWIFRFTNIKAARVIISAFNHRWRFYCFNRVRFPDILIRDRISMHGLEDLRLVLTSNLNYFLHYIEFIDLFLINYLYTKQIWVW